MGQFISQSFYYQGFQDILYKQLKHRKWDSYSSTGQIAPLLLEGQYGLISLIDFVMESDFNAG